MFRYIGLMWNPADPSEVDAARLIDRTIAERAPTLQTCFRSNGLMVLCSGCDGFNVYPMASGSGVVLGRLFRRRGDLHDDSAAAEATFNSADNERLAVSKGRSLISDYWGEYVAFLVDKSSAAKRIIKDPTGNLPCFRTSWRKVNIVFSCLGDCIDLRIFRFTVNWSYVESHVGSGGYDYSRNALNEVSEVHRGECLEITSHGQSSAEFYWKPASFAQPEGIVDDPVFAAKALRATVRSATRTLAQSHERVLVRLSGGLDSSIIAACIKSIRPSPVVTSYTYFAPNGRSDERRWARLAADFVASEHLEIAIDPSRVRLEPLVDLRPSVTPVQAFTQFKLGEMEREIARTHPHTAVFSGDGGDSGFGGDCISSAVDDLIRLKGLSRGIVKLASQVALRTDTLAWSVLGSAMRRYILGTRIVDYRERLLRGTALAAGSMRGIGLNSSRFPHPWFSGCNEVPWHVINRVGNLLATPEFYDVFLAPTSAAPFRASPLYSQPVVELSLRIPVFTHFHEGRERGLARMAFSQEVPSPILRRQWKDRAPRAFEEMVRRNRKFLRELLLGGSLCSRGFLDADAVDSVLSNDFHGNRVLCGEMFKHLNLELWLRHFVAGPVPQVAA
jgi:asparagine synthase (glutamine-hydrolysing)